MFNSPNVDYLIAKCYLEQAQYDQALTHVDRAIARDSRQPEYYLVKSQAEYYSGEGGRFDAAMEALDQCSMSFPQYVPMLLAKAALLSANGNDNEALGYLNAAVANDPGDAEALLSRALVLRRWGNDMLAVRDLNTVALMSDDMYDMKGFAQSLLGRENEAFRWLNQLTSLEQPGGENYFYAALFMTMRGDNYKARDYLQKAIDNGFGSMYRLRDDVLSPLNLKSLRDEPEFELLMEKARL